MDSDDVEKNAIYFERKLLNTEKLDKKLLMKYFDLDSNGKIDKDAEKLLNDLKRTKLRKKLPSSNIFEFEVS